MNDKRGSGNLFLLLEDLSEGVNKGDDWCKYNNTGRLLAGDNELLIGV